MGSQAQTAPFYPAITESKILVQAGVSEIASDEIGGVKSKVQSVGVLYGWSIAESTGSAAAKVRLWDGTTNKGSYQGTIGLSSGQTVRDFFPIESVELRNNALFLEVISGSVEGVVYYG